MATYQASHNKDRAAQLTRIMESRKELPREPEGAMQALLWEKYEQELAAIDAAGENPK